MAEVRSVSRFSHFSASHSTLAAFKHRRHNDTSIYCGFTTDAVRLPVLTMHKGGGV